MPLDDLKPTLSTAPPIKGPTSRVQTEDAEWTNPRNWHGGFMNFYFSRRDTRAFVPKRGTEVGGATVNFARLPGVLFIVGILLFVALIYALNG